MYIGDYAEDYATLNHRFTTRATTGVPTTLSGSPVVSVYKGSATDTEKTSAESYITLSVDFDGITGLNNVLLDLSGDAFFAAGEDYSIVITSGTVGGVSVVGEVVATFSIENRSANTVVPDAAGTAAALIGALNDFDGTGATLHSDYDAAKTAAQEGDAMTLAAEAMNAAALKADAVTAIQSGLSTHDAADVWSASGRELSTPSAYKADVSNLDVAVSTRSSHTAADVWSVGARTLTSFGTLAADIWASGTRTLTSFGTLVADIWAASTITGGLDAAETRAALGMAAADLDTQLDSIAKTGADADTLKTLSEQLDAIEVGAAGGGDTPVNHDTGGDGNLTYEYPEGTGIGGATVRAYLASEYAAGGRTVRGQVTTADDGTWETDMYLDSGETYVFHFFKNDAFAASTKTVEIP